MNLVFLHGPPAVGKLTVGRELTTLTGYRLFHNHLVVDALLAVFDFGSEPFVRLREELWIAVFREAAAQDVSCVFTFAPERTVRPGFPERVVAAVEESGGRVLFVELTCESAELERRIEDPSRSAHGKLGSRERFRELLDGGSFDYPAPPSDLVVDTGGLQPAEAAARIRDFFALGSARAV